MWDRLSGVFWEGRFQFQVCKRVLVQEVQAVQRPAHAVPAVMPHSVSEAGERQVGVRALVVPPGTYSVSRVFRTSGARRSSPVLPQSKVAVGRPPPSGTQAPPSSSVGCWGRECSRKVGGASRALVAEANSGREQQIEAGECKSSRAALQRPRLCMQAGGGRGGAGWLRSSPYPGTVAGRCRTCTAPSCENGTL